MGGDAREALGKYREAIACSPPHGLHKLLSNASLAALTCGDVKAATALALQAVDAAPADYTTVSLRVSAQQRVGGHQWAR